MYDNRELFVYFSPFEGPEIEFKTRTGVKRVVKRPTKGTLDRIQHLTWSHNFRTGVIFGVNREARFNRAASITVQPRQEWEV